MIDAPNGTVILAEPISQSPTIALMAGDIASLLISRMAVPVIYFMANTKPSLPQSLHKPVTDEA